jgi:DNA-3-methyladenine glycosylase II
MLSLDVDPAPWREVLERDPILAALQSKWPGFRPVCFASPWEAAIWGVLVQGIGMQRAAKLRASLAERYGERIEIGSASSFVFPAPAKVLELDPIEGLDAERARRLRAVAEVAITGKLDADRLRSIPATDALRELRSIRGIGEWTASHILLRGAALADGDALGEPRVLRGIAAAYDCGEDEDTCAKITERWLPYRMWGAILVVRALRGTEGWRETKRRR